MALRDFCMKTSNIIFYFNNSTITKHQAFFFYYAHLKICFFFLIIFILHVLCYIFRIWSNSQDSEMWLIKILRLVWLLFIQDLNYKISRWNKFTTMQYCQIINIIITTMTIIAIPKYKIYDKNLHISLVVYYFLLIALFISFRKLCIISQLYYSITLL